MKSNQLYILAVLAAAGLGTIPSQAVDARFFYDTCKMELTDTVAHIPANVTSIPPYAFAGMKNLKRVEFNNGSRLRSIGAYAFLQCDSLREIDLPPTLTTLGESCFQECRNLREIRMPRGVTVIPAKCFTWCDNLRTVIFSPRLADIKRSAFAYCSSLDSITLPSTLRHIGLNAFSFCSSLQEIRLPASITELESYAFSECTSLRHAVLPGNRRLLGELIFSGCRSLERLTEPAAAPPAFDCQSFPFEPDETALYEKCVLFVPSSAISAYRRAHGWSLFKNIESK